MRVSTRMSRSERSGKGFTLIELLVVIAIIAILAAILFPVFARAREKARQATCQSNHKQLALAFNMYAQDYDETSLPYYNWVAIWPALLYPYTKNIQLYACPSTNYHPTMAIVGPGGSSQPIKIGLNINLFNYAGYFTPSLADLDLPSETAVFSDCTNYDWVSLPGGIGAVYTVPSYRHNETCNVAFADGHVKAYKQGALEATAVNSSGRNVAWDSNGNWLSEWTNNPGIEIFKLWQTAAGSTPHI